MVIKFTLNGKLLYTYDTTEGIEFPYEYVKKLYEQEQRRIIMDWITEHYGNIIKEVPNE